MANMKNLFLIGIILVFIGILFIIISSVYTSFKGKTEIKSAGVIFIGPFPIGWASDKKMFYILSGLIIMSLIIWWILNH